MSALPRRLPAGVDSTEEPDSSGVAPSVRGEADRDFFARLKLTSAFSLA